MTLSKLLDDVAKGHGAEALEGAMVFVMLDRGLDKLISSALGLGPYHRGKPSPWSHCFLLAEPYKGATTKILDCTIRDAKGRIEWQASLDESLKILVESTVGKGAGAVYDAELGDYDDPRVTARGVRWLPGLAPDERGKIIDQGRALQAAKARYDLPGPLRELVRLIIGIAMPPAQNRLFCSAFLQRAYRAALGQIGDFGPSIGDEDTTPDDIWYSHRGLGIADTGNSPQSKAAHSSEVIEMFGASGEAAALQAEPLVAVKSMVPADDTRTAIVQALAKLDAAAAKGRVTNTEPVFATLKNALAQLDRVASFGDLGQSDAALHSDDLDLSIVLSALSAPPQPTATAALFGRNIVGFHQYEVLDLAWLASVLNDVTRTKVPFATWANARDGVFQVPDETTIAIAGDWGTGNESSLRIATEITKLNPQYTIHLGDVYYSGTESEERQRLIEPWPAGSCGSFALNSNHEMYSGGHGYFGIALSNSKFRTQQGRSYFALTNSVWLILGLDSAYAASSFYQTGALNDAQLSWIRDLLASDVARSGGVPKNVMVLTHHHGFDFDGKHREPLFSQVTSALGRGPHRWYWGHVHGVAAFAPINLGGVQMRARLVGHGGVPYAPDAKTSAVEWLENELAKDRAIPQRAKNGFAFLKFGDEFEETFRDEFGQVRWRTP